MLVSFARKVRPIAAPVAYSHAARPVRTNRTRRSSVSVASIVIGPSSRTWRETTTWYGISARSSAAISPVRRPYSCLPSS